MIAKIIVLNSDEKDLAFAFAAYDTLEVIIQVLMVIKMVFAVLSDHWS